MEGSEWRQMRRRGKHGSLAGTMLSMRGTAARRLHLAPEYMASGALGARVAAPATATEHAALMATISP